MTGYGLGLYGYSWYDLAVERSTSINAFGYIGEYPSGHSINAFGYISDLKSLTLYGKGFIAIQPAAHSINAFGNIAEYPTPKSINASALIAEAKAAVSINAYGNISEWKAFNIYASGLIRGTTEWSINAHGNIAAQSSPFSINAKGTIASYQIKYVNARGTIALARSTSLNAWGRIKGDREYSINAGGRITEQMGPHSINAHGNIAERLTFTLYGKGHIALQSTPHSINGRGNVAQSHAHPINAKGNIAALSTAKTINAKANIGQYPSAKSINAAGTIAALLALSIDAYGDIGSFQFASINCRGLIDLQYHTFILASGLIIASPYYYLNGVDVTDIMLEGLKPTGPDRKLGKKYYPGQEKVLISDDGYGVKEYAFESEFTNLTEAFDYMYDVMDTTKDMRFYPGDSLWFHKAAFINAFRQKRRAHYLFIIKTIVTMAKPWLYLDIPTSWSSGSITLPRTSSNIINHGHYDTPLESLQIIGHYSSGYPRYISYSIMDGVNQISTILLTNKLLSEELIELDEDGILKSTYADLYSSSTIWGHDAIQSGCTCAGGKVTIGSGGYYYYRFEGPWPLIDNIALTTKLNIISGSPVIEVSNDAMATWQTAVATTDIGNNISKTYYMTGSDRCSDIYIRFRCPTGAVMEVEDVSFVAQRRTTGTSTPTIAPNSTRQIKISDGSGSTHAVTILATFRERRRAI